MTDQDARRHVSIERTGAKKYTATNDHGGTIAIGDGSGSEFTPVELLLAAIAGCTAIDVDIVTTRRAEPVSFQVDTDALKQGGAEGNHLENIVVTYRIEFPDGEAGDSARAILPDIVKKSHDRLCTVSRTVERGTPVSTKIA
jgi:uncharacterized OsmC-like protein